MRVGGENLREVLLVRHHQLEPPAQDRRALLAGLRTPCRPRAVGGIGGESLRGKVFLLRIVY